MEIQVLRIIDNEKHNNIIDVIAFYCWRGELNCVFPFVEFNLYEVLHKNWKPQSIVHLPRSLRHWLWQQMHRVADALAAIHNPRKQERRTDGRKIIAFHFDLKPQNILVTPDGTLKITDFGQSMVKMVQENESEYGTYVGGDPAYGPPEVLGRDEIDMLRSMVFPTNLTASQQLSNPVPSPPPSSAGSQTNASDFRRPSAPSLVRSTQSSIRDPVGDIEQESRRDSYSYVSSISAPSSTSLDHHPSIATANYDVWSLACIMVEVLVFIFNEESAGIPEFEDARRNEEPDGRGLCFHKGTRGNSSLKKCVRATLDKLKDPLDAAATPGQPPSYLDDVVRLIDSMFIIDPKKRHSSDRVIWEFNKLADIHKDDNDPNANIARIMRSLGPVEGFNELGYKPDKKSGDIVPFYNMCVSTSDSHEFYKI
jgi:serine/threonine protein kinase